MNDREIVWLTALGIQTLADLLLSDQETIVIQTASYMASLSHMRAGITDAMITCDTVDILCDHLYSNNEQIRLASAVTLGYLTYNRTASRYLLHNCRNVVHLFDQLKSNLIPGSRISDQFIESYQTAIQLGLPKLLVKTSIKFFDRSSPQNDINSKSKTKTVTIENKEKMYSFYQEPIIRIKTAKLKSANNNRRHPSSHISMSMKRTQSAPMFKLKKTYLYQNNNIDTDKNDTYNDKINSFKKRMKQRPESQNYVN
jgi:hypothetical protein